MKIDVNDASAVQNAVDKVVAGVGVRFTSVDGGVTLPMARVTVGPSPWDDGVNLHILPMWEGDKDVWGTPLDELETVGDDDEGLRFVCDGREYTIYPLGDADPRLIEAGQTYEQRMAQAHQDQSDTLDQLHADATQEAAE